MKLSLPDLVLRNFWLKFFSVTLAVVIWLGINYDIRKGLSISQLNINSIRVPVSTKSLPGDSRAFKIIPNEVVVFAVGDKTALREGIRAYVDLTSMDGSQNPAADVHVDAPPEIKVIAISPPTVAVGLVSK